MRWSPGFSAAILLAAAGAYPRAAVAQTHAVAEPPRAAFPIVADTPQATPVPALPPAPPAPDGVSYGYTAPYRPAPESFQPMPYAPRDQPLPTRTRKIWYGYQTLITDGASLGALVLGAGNNSDALEAMALGGYLLGGPIVHLAHGRPGIAFADLGLRTGLPVALAYAGVALEDCTHSSDEFCGLAGAALGIVLGMAGAIAVDSSLFAREEVEEKPSVTVAPILGTNRAGLAMAGTF